MGISETDPTCFHINLLQLPKEYMVLNSVGQRRFNLNGQAIKKYGALVLFLMVIEKAVKKMQKCSQLLTE